MSDTKTAAANPAVEICQKAYEQATSAYGQTADAWKKMVTQQTAQLAAAFEQIAAAQTQGAADVRKVIDDSARMMREAVESTFRLSAEWRRLALEATSRGVAAVRPQA